MAGADRRQRSTCRYRKSHPVIGGTATGIAAIVTAMRRASVWQQVSSQAPRSVWRPALWPRPPRRRI